MAGREVRGTGEVTDAYQVRAAKEIEYRRFRSKVDDGDDIAAIVFGPDDPAAVLSRAVGQMVDIDPTRPVRNHGPTVHFSGGELDPADDSAEKVDGYHQGELALWSPPVRSDDTFTVVIDGERLPVLGRRPERPVTFDISQPEQFETVTWSDESGNHGEHRVLTVEEWRDDRNRNPDPPQWCSLFTTQRSKTRVDYIGCHQPLPLDWPEALCEFPSQPRAWWRDDRPAYCHCNGCLTHPKSHGRKHCPEHVAVIDNAQDRERRRLAGAKARGKRTGIDVIADHLVRYRTDMRERGNTPQGAGPY